MHQQTVKTEFSLSGVGVHSGEKATITVKPAPADSGITFVRTDITDRPNAVEARWDRVVDSRLCTLIGNEAGVTVSTIEHLMSAFAVLGLDNAVVEIDGPEMPIMDGSAIVFLKALRVAGLVAQKKPRKAIRILKTIVVSEDGKEVSLTPAAAPAYTMEVEFESNAIGYQHYSCDLDAEHYADQIASARTFGFLHEVEYLRSIGLAKGGSLENAVVVEGDRVLNPEGLRFADEFARHKLLDAIGDLYTAGLTIVGKYHGFKASHAMNNKLLRVLLADPDAYEIIVLETTTAGASAPASLCLTA